MTGCSLTALVVAINSPSSLAYRLSTSVSRTTPCPPLSPGRGGRKEARGPPPKASAPQPQGRARAGGLFQGPLRASTVIGRRGSPAARRGPRCAGGKRGRGSGGGGRGSGGQGAPEPVLPPPAVSAPPPVRRSQLRWGRAAPQVLKRILNEVGCRHLAKPQAPDPRRLAGGGRGAASRVPRRRSPPQKHAQAGCTSGPASQRAFMETERGWGPGAARRGHMLARSRCSREL